MTRGNGNFMKFVYRYGENKVYKVVGLNRCRPYKRYCCLVRLVVVFDLGEFGVGVHDLFLEGFLELNDFGL